MKCQKCSGFSLFETTYQYQGWRCFNCGKRVFYDHFEDRCDFSNFLIFVKNQKVSLPIEKVLIKKCMFCKKTFKATREYKKLCSDECRYKLKKQRRSYTITTICGFCFKSFLSPSRKKKYCDRICFKNFMKCFAKSFTT